MEAVWNYPRPPALAPDRRRVRVEFAGATIADSTSAIRVLETSHPPTYYLPPRDVRTELLTPVEGRSFCEWKGQAGYLTINVAGVVAANAAWSYPKPTKAFAAIAGYYAFYASRVHACYVGDERVVPQPGGFYGGWITSDLKGPFKGEKGTEGW
ncbi:MAG: DUF427 domain-containing protein [Alphaproteobacteria bacterium]|nr:DUF427 domain-containing protein [Alphaproteobacteria bacterium]